MPRLATMTKKEIAFQLYAPNAKKVSIGGSFNKWSASLMKAKKDTKGNWKAMMKLEPGRYEYKFFVDGHWQTDPNNCNCVTNSFGTQNSILCID